MKNNYRIFRVEPLDKNGDRVKKITMTTFYAVDKLDAYQYLNKYKTVANKKYEYFFENYSPVYITDKHGKKQKFDSIDDLRLHNIQIKSTFSRLYRILSNSMYRIFIDIPRNIISFFYELGYFIKHKQYYRASWDLDMYLLETLEHNLKIIIKDKYGIDHQFIEEALKYKQQFDKDFDYNEYMTKINQGQNPENDDIRKNALILQTEKYNEIIEAIQLYKYYVNFGVSDDKNFEKKWNYTLPYIPGMYKQFDFDKLTILTQKQWNKIWEFVRKYGQTFWI